MNVIALENARTTRPNPDSESPLALILARSGLPESTINERKTAEFEAEQHQDSLTILHPKHETQQAPTVRKPDPARGRVFVAINRSFRIEVQAPTLPIPSTAYAWAQEGDSEWMYLIKPETPSG